MTCPQGGGAGAAGAKSPAEAGPEARAETRTKRPVTAGVLTADVVAELATGLPALFVLCTPCMGVKAEALCSGTPGEFPFYMGEWVVHMSSRFWKGSAVMRYRYSDDISKTIVMQR